MIEATRIRPHLTPIDGPDDEGHQEGREVAGDADGAVDEGDRVEESEVINMDDEERHGEAQAARPRVARSPREPTSLERELHEVTHIPLRTWCRHCMLGRCKDAYHSRLGDGSKDVPRVGMDYMHISDNGVTNKIDEIPENIDETITMLVLKDAWHKSIWVYPVEGKGVTAAAWLPEMVKTDMAACGLDNCMLVVKSDQEPAIKELQEELARQRRIDGAVGTVIENSKVGDSSSNGRTERAIQEVGGMIRTLKFALEDRTGGGKISLAHPIIPWIAKHAAAQITRYQVRATGKTSYNSIKGYDCRDPMAEFGECVLFRPPKTKHETRHKKVLAERAIDGVWLGTDIKTSANIVATPDGVFFAGRILRKAPGDRWSLQASEDEARDAPQEGVSREGH